MTVDEGLLLATVDDAFATSAAGLRAWVDPHPDRMPADEEYSRCLDPGKYRMVGARADAWLMAVERLGLAAVSTDVKVMWSQPPGTRITRTAVARPAAQGAIAMVVARSRIGDVADAGVVIGAGSPAVSCAALPECGCDACDSGSQDLLDELDEMVHSVISGRFRRLTRGRREITVRSQGGWSASGNFRRGEVESIVTNPVGWAETSGAPWS